MEDSWRQNPGFFFRFYFGISYWTKNGQFLMAVRLWDPLAFIISLQLVGTSVSHKRCSEPGMECGKTRLKFPSKCWWTNKNKIQEKPWPKTKRMASVFRAKTDGSSFLRDFTVLALFKKHCLKTWSNLDLSRIPHHPTWKWEKVSPAHTSKKDLEYIENAQCSMLFFSH